MNTDLYGRPIYLPTQMKKQYKQDYKTVDLILRLEQREINQAMKDYFDYVQEEKINNNPDIKPLILWFRERYI